MGGGGGGGWVHLGIQGGYIRSLSKFNDFRPKKHPYLKKTFSSAKYVTRVRPPLYLSAPPPPPGSSTRSHFIKHCLIILTFAVLGEYKRRDRAMKYRISQMVTVDFAISLLLHYVAPPGEPLPDVAPCSYYTRRGVWICLWIPHI